MCRREDDIDRSASSTASMNAVKRSLSTARGSLQMSFFVLRSISNPLRLVEYVPACKESGVIVDVGRGDRVDGACARAAKKLHVTVVKDTIVAQLVTGGSRDHTARREHMIKRIGKISTRDRHAGPVATVGGGGIDDGPVGWVHRAKRERITSTPARPVLRGSPHVGIRLA